MAPPVTHSGEMSQDSSRPRAPATGAGTGLTPGIDQAARRGRSAVDQLSMSAVGLELGISVVLGLLGGRWLDGRLGAEPWCMIVGVCIGFAAGLRGAMRAMKRADRLAARDAHEAGAAPPPPPAREAP